MPDSPYGDVFQVVFHPADVCMVHEAAQRSTEGAPITEKEQVDG